MRLNIHYKITLVFSLILAAVLFGIYIYLNNNLRAHTLSRIEANLLREASLAQALVEENLENRRLSYDLDETADEIGNRLKLRVTIIGIDGTVFGDTDLDGDNLRKVENHLYRPEAQEALEKGFGSSRRYSKTVKKDMLYVALPFGKETPAGIIRLSMPLLEISVISVKLKKLLAISLFAAFIFAILISFVASSFISKPIKEISWAAKDMANGDFSNRISVSTNDEIGDLAKAFGYMSEQIKHRIEEVTANKSRLEAVFLSMFDGIMVVDSKGAILLINQALKKLLLAADDPRGRKPLEVIRNIEIQEIVDDTLKLNEGVTSREISVIIPEEKILLVHATPVLIESKTEGAVLVFHDITELRRLEKIRQDFVANVSHELRTPVSNIKGYAETLLEGAIKDKKHAEEFIKIIYSDSERLANLITDLLDLSKIESGKLRMELKPCALGPIVKRITKGLEKEARDKQVSIKVNIPDGVPEILADEARIAQVVLNLVDNAVKYNKEKGTVVISAKEKGAFIQTEVADTGIGMSEKDLPRVFERFYRIDKARSRELGGTGLGLSIVKHIVQAHGGQVSVQSVLEEGSTFSFTIPKA